jgi:hypothetical protein
MLINEHGAAGEMTCKGIISTRRKLAPMSFCASQIPHDMTWNRTRAAVAGFSTLVLFRDVVSINFLNLITICGAVSDKIAISCLGGPVNEQYFRMPIIDRMCQNVHAPEVPMHTK